MPKAAQEIVNTDKNYVDCLHTYLVFRFLSTNITMTHTNPKDLRCSLSSQNYVTQHLLYVTMLPHSTKLSVLQYPHLLKNGYHKPFFAKPIIRTVFTAYISDW